MFMFYLKYIADKISYKPSNSTLVYVTCMKHVPRFLVHLSPKSGRWNPQVYQDVGQHSSLQIKVIN